MKSTFGAVLLAEVRTARRLARTWVLSVLAVVTTLIGFLFYSNLHGQMSSFVPSVVTSPRFLVDSFGGYLLWFLLAAAVFLGFDIGNRERRERIADALDTRPVSNLQLLAGRLAGVVATLAVPIAAAFALMQGIGGLGQAFDWDIRASIEASSLAVFFAVDALPTLAFWGAAVFLLAALLRSRVAVAVVAFGLLGLVVWGLSRAPAWLVETVAPSPDRLVSDLVSSVPDAATFVQRLSVLLAAAGVLAAAALCLSRPDTASRIRHAIFAVLSITGGIAGNAIVIVQAHAELATRAHWRAAQTSVPGPGVDIRTVAGEVRIDPGSELALDISLEVAAPDPATGVLVFAFNPGLATRAVSIHDKPVGFKHRDGLLRVDLPPQVGDPVPVTVRAAGIPDPDFAYLDSAIDYRAIRGANPLRNLGTEGSLFDRGYVALMPGVRWLPGTTATTRDFLSVDLVVQVPSDWLVAGPGRRESRGTGRYRFAPKTTVTQIALLASNFERFATMIDGTELELLLSPRHTAPAAYFEDSVAEITDALSAILEDIDAVGLPYPYDALQMVEVPARLRGYGGGWQMPTALALPGMLLIRERGFPTARFHATTVPAGSPLTTEKLGQLRMFFREDRNGADPFAGLAYNLFLYQTGVSGPGAVALEYLCHGLVTRLLDAGEDYFSAHIFAASPSIRTMLVDSVTSTLAGGSGRVSAEIFGAVRPPSVWERTLGTPLVDLAAVEPSRAAQAVNILTMKGDALARVIVDDMGREATALLVAELVRRYRGASFTAADFERVAAELGVDLHGLLGDWLHDAALPGFLASAVTTERLADGAAGEPRYQLRVDVFNGEDVPGLFRLRYRVGDADSRMNASDPVRVPGRRAMEVGLVTQKPIRELWVAPYLSLNRREFPLRVPDTATTATTAAAPLVGARPSAWRPASGSGIVIDDLDPGFSATGPAHAASSANGPGIDRDEGVPVYQRLDPVFEAHWSRQEQPTSWGRYRHTIARITPGTGDREATFSAVLPAAGRWRVDYHLPDLTVRYPTRSHSPFQTTASFELTPADERGPQPGSYDMRLVNGESEFALEFDAAAAEPGWTTLGRFDLSAGKASLVVTNRTDGSSVVADAVRWTRED